MRWPGRGRSVAFVAADGHALPFDAGSFDLVWSNLALHWFDDRPRALGEWQRVLRPQGVLMFSAWGVDTLVELRRAGVLMPEWPDMHDLGDALLQAGFADPVMETERLTITWSDVRRMVAELRAWGGDARLGRRSGCVTPRQAQRAQEALWAQLCASQGQQTVGLTVELIYGHAWRGGQGVAPEGYAPIQLLRRGV
jgi:malonyl-CoA O-methyltransferase